MFSVPRRELLGILGACSVCELSRGKLLECNWSIDIHHVHAVPRRELLDCSRGFGEYHVHAVPRRALLDISWGFKLYHVHTVPRRDLLSDHRCECEGRVSAVLERELLSEGGARDCVRGVSVGGRVLGWR